MRTPVLLICQRTTKINRASVLTLSECQLELFQLISNLVRMGAMRRIVLFICLLVAGSSLLFSAEPLFAADDSPFVTPEDPETFLDRTWYGHLADYTLVYSEPSLSADVVRNVGDGFLYVSILFSEKKADGVWYKINYNEWVHEDDLTPTKKSDFRGYELTRNPDRAFGWIVIGHVQPSAAPDQEPDPDFDRLERYDFFEVYDVAQGDEWIWYNIGDGRWIEQTNVSLVNYTEPPDDIPADAKWTVVDLYEQTFSAYEGDQMVYASLISSGLNRWPTREGVFQVWDRYEFVKMSGAEGEVDYYFVEDVPYTMYFDESKGIALHGAYWHDRFGYKHSHGCVNMPLRDAEWVWHWSEGDDEALWVWVYESDPEHILRPPNLGKQRPPRLARVTGRLGIKTLDLPY